MNYKQIILYIVSMLLILSMIVLPLFSQGHGKRRQEITITSYDISVQVYEKPFAKLDEKGQKKSYSKAYVVRLKGNFGEVRAIPVDIFIGDYKVPEYGGTEDGIYFKIYDEKLLQKLENKAFGYGYQNQKIKTFKLKLRPSKKKPFKKFVEKKKK